MLFLSFELYKYFISFYKNNRLYLEQVIFQTEKLSWNRFFHALYTIWTGNIFYNRALILEYFII